MKHNQFSCYIPNDSQELCSLILEDLNLELNEVKSKPLYYEICNNSKSKYILDNAFYDNFNKRENSIITKYFILN